ncbi:TetR/AcrR family transcriptional regulator [Desulfallas thermosapovorans]|uniref:TetR family transcriptional regulator n=1 Tax=Desulfallas thermosapovorans DSM 6562 TaxID=1121431 RepID=A0A5S4ZQV2_9FIRM|nr:TetR/AcrR family transcriptional regulator [Desulfallas thermosapovorans]TYO93932.1 TetR family transcriptional regulator [Desulfallas thermosapovorans DSM 6562]
MNTRNQILNSAVQLFGTKGYHATSIQDICRLAGVSKGAIFHYFSNKIELLFEIHEVIIDILLDKYNNVLDHFESSPTLKLKQLVNISVELVVEYKPYIAVLFREYKNLQNDDHYFLITKAKRDQCESVVQEVIRQGVTSGEFRQDIELSIMAKLFFGVCNWTYIWLDPKGPLTPQQISDSIWQLFIGGLAAGPQNCTNHNLT